MFKPALVMNLYLMRVYIVNFLIFLLGILAIIYLFDTVELLRRAAKFDNVPLSLTLTMGLYKLPEIGQLVFPFAVLFSAMFTFWQLNRRHEITILKSAGFSAWQFIMPLIIVAFLIGAVKITLINPMGSFFITQYEKLENDYLEKESNLIMLSKQGLWLRQDHDGGKAILHADKIQFPSWQLNNVMVLFFKENNDFVRRIDSKTAELQTGQWIFINATSNIPGNLPEKADLLSMATDLTIDDLEDSFAAPETISFWKLPNYIDVLEATGFDATSVKIYFQKLLSDPLLFAAMVLLAASVSLRPPRSRSDLIMALFGIGIGFLLFFGSSYLQALGASGQIPVYIAAWFPAIIAMIGGITAIMFLEDG